MTLRIESTSVARVNVTVAADVLCHADNPDAWRIEYIHGTIPYLKRPAASATGRGGLDGASESPTRRLRAQRLATNQNWRLLATP